MRTRCFTSRSQKEGPTLLPPDYALPSLFHYSKTSWFQVEHPCWTSQMSTGLRILKFIDLYASSGDGPALEVVHNYFQALFFPLPTGTNCQNHWTCDGCLSECRTSGAAAAEGLKMFKHNASTFDPNPFNPCWGTQWPCFGCAREWSHDYFGQTVNIASRIESEAAH